MMEVLALSLMTGALGILFLDIHNGRLNKKQLVRINKEEAKRKAADVEMVRVLKEALVQKELKK